jgi:hypothetical protein
MTQQDAILKLNRLHIQVEAAFNMVKTTNGDYHETFKSENVLHIGDFTIIDNFTASALRCGEQKERHNQ